MIADCWLLVIPAGAVVLAAIRRWGPKDPPHCDTCQWCKSEAGGD